MKKYLITYDLKNTAIEGYLPLHEAIKKNCISWWHYLESTWIVKSNILNANDISSKLTPFVKTGDRLLVVEITSNSQGLLPKEAWDWLNSD